MDKIEIVSMETDLMIRFEELFKASLECLVRTELESWEPHHERLERAIDDLEKTAWARELLGWSDE